ncbi:MAG TPA: NAD(P)/FAD-dependent oxidoreductase, partial [Albitalea sp.]|nr:NAD(P)/FAD-dependent oxidoreductase [Albitalea sp.]
MWDAIVIGSGIGGLAAAAALAKRERRVLMLEQHSVAGGLTQTFQRQGWRFAPGVHYIGGVGPQPGPDGQFGRLLGWLSDGALRFEPCANPYDIVRLPGFEFGIAHPESAYRDALRARFPQQHAAIDRWFDACEAARRSAFTLFALHSMPTWLAWGLRQWRGAQAEHWAQRTLADELARISDPLLRAVLGARWGDHGAPPAQAPFVEHALVTGAYNAGAYYPVGGPARFAQTLLPVIEAAGGELQLGADVKHIVTDQGRACGVEFEQHGERRRVLARHVISAMGVGNTVACLDADAAAPWQQTIRGLAPGVSSVSLFLGFEGDIAAAGASSANHWIYESEDIGALWQQPADDDAPGFFVSFPSLKDPTAHGQPTAEVVAVIDAGAFAPWLALPDGERPEEYLALKAWVEERLLAQFLRHFPALRPMLRLHELSTPVTQRRYVRSPDGAMYGIEMTAERLTSRALHVRTPLPGLFLAGQDVVSPGVPGAFM